MIKDKEKLFIPKLKSQFRYINEILYSSNTAEVVFAAIETGIFDILKDKELSAAELAAEMNTRPEITESLADVLVAMNLLNKNNLLYSLTVESEEFLVSDSPACQVDFIMNSRQYQQLIKSLPELLKNDPQEQNVHNDEVWADENTMIMMGQAVLGGQIQDCREFICGLPGFQSMKKMCDLAGNHGYYTMSLIDKNSKLKGVICDLPATVKTASKMIRDKGYEDRMETLAADIYTDPIGENYDLVFCSHVLYKWGKTGGLDSILKKVNRSLNPGGLFVSNHLTLENESTYSLPSVIMELMAKLGGYPAHSLSRELLENTLNEAGFDVLKVRAANESSYYNTLLLAAKKVKDV